MLEASDLVQRLGQLFIVGFPGETLPSAFLDFVSKAQLGGVLLFEDNCPTHARTRRTIQQLTGFFDTAPFVAIDQEGGRVSRLRGAPAEYQSPAFYGHNHALERFREEYERSAVYMESLGINLNLAPVADVSHPDNRCLLDRCFGEEPDVVAEFVEAAVTVSHSSGLLCCVKHFPGLGSARIDPHKAVAEVEYDRMDWQQHEKGPFAAGVRAGADLLMTTHVVAPAIDESMATASSVIVAQMARAELGFDGPVITDDLTMHGATDLGSYGERALAALDAGHDLLLFGRDFSAAVQAYEYLVDAYRNGRITSERLELSLDRVAGLKYKLGRFVLK